MTISHHRYLLILALLFGAEWIVLAIDPLYRNDWALVAMTFIVLLNSYLQRDFAREWNESLRVKHKEPLGEDEIVRLLEKR